MAKQARVGAVANETLVYGQNSVFVGAVASETLVYGYNSVFVGAIAIETLVVETASGLPPELPPRELSVWTGSQWEAVAPLDHDGPVDGLASVSTFEPAGGTGATWLEWLP